MGRPELWRMRFGAVQSARNRWFMVLCLIGVWMFNEPQWVAMLAVWARTSTHEPYHRPATFASAFKADASTVRGVSRTHSFLFRHFQKLRYWHRVF